VHPFRASLTVGLLMLLSLTFVGPAAAGGPTSVLLSVPGEGRTASLYYTDAEYDQLARLVGIGTDTGTWTVDRSGQDHASGPGITVTWMVHDVLPWRVDRIYPNGKGAPWIATQLGEGETVLQTTPTWHQARDGAELMALLDTLRVADAARQADDFDGVAGAPVPEPGQTQPNVTASADADDADGIAGVWWALGGLLAGVLATLLGSRLRRTGRPDAPETSRESSPEAAGAAEELSGPGVRR